jgi:hypothetical protein
MAQNTNRPLKAYVRFDGTGRIVPSSLILRRKKPKVGKWVEIPAYECCNYVPSSTTTTSTSTTTTTTTVAPGPTQYLLLFDGEFPSAFPSTAQACSVFPVANFLIVYAAESSIGSITYLYTDSGLTTPVANTSPLSAYNGLAVPSGLSYTTPYTLQIIGGTGQVSNLVACP